MQSAAEVFEHGLACVCDILRLLWILKIEIDLIGEVPLTRIGRHLIALIPQLGRKPIEISYENGYFAWLRLHLQQGEEVLADVACWTCDQNVLTIK